MSIDSLARVARRFCATRGMGSTADRDAVVRMVRTAYEIGIVEGERLARIERNVVEDERIARIERNEQEAIIHAEEE